MRERRVIPGNIVTGDGTGKLSLIVAAWWRSPEENQYQELYVLQARDAGKGVFDWDDNDEVQLVFDLGC